MSSSFPTWLSSNSIFRSTSCSSCSFFFSFCTHTSHYAQNTYSFGNLARTCSYHIHFTESTLQITCPFSDAFFLRLPGAQIFRSEDALSKRLKRGLVCILHVLNLGYLGRAVHAVRCRFLRKIHLYAFQEQRLIFGNGRTNNQHPASRHSTATIHLDLLQVLAAVLLHHQRHRQHLSTHQRLRVLLKGKKTNQFYAAAEKGERGVVVAIPRSHLHGVLRRHERGGDAALQAHLPWGVHPAVDHQKFE